MDIDFDSIGKLIDSLSEDDLGALRAAAQSVLGGQEDAAAPEEEGAPDAFSAAFTPEMMKKLSRMMSLMRRRDSRTELIAALKPLLSPGRRGRADEAMQLIRMIDILPELKDKL